MQEGSSRSEANFRRAIIIDYPNKDAGCSPDKRMPDEKFHRSIGDYAGKTYSVTGELLSPEEYEKHLKEVMPSDADDEFVIGLEKEKDWIVDPQQR